MNAFNAKQQFSDNLQLVGNAWTDPEKFNLYSGLYNLAESLEQIQNELNQVKSDIQILIHK